jgi:TPR repeat protein/serine/threonine protein kinase
MLAVMLTPGTIVAGDFRIERALSEGGMGAVYVAEQLSTGSMRALKVIKTELLHQVRLRQRFEQEAKVTSRIASDHVVSVVAAGIDTKLAIPWIAMELLQGQTLADVVRDRGPLPPAGALGILAQLAHAMDAAHRVGVVHRDLKPENIFLAESRRSGTPYFVKVLDFGIARVIREAQVSHTDSLGTPLWMAPEQAGTGEAVGPTTDIWALGLIVFFLLTGKPYWLSAREGGTALSIVKEVCLNPIDKASVRALALETGVTLPAAFDEWFANAVVREPEARFPSAGVAVAALRKACGLEDLPTEAKDPLLPGSGGALRPDALAVLPDAKTELAIAEPSATPAIPVSLAQEPVASSTGDLPSNTPSGMITKRSPGAEKDSAEKKRRLPRFVVPIALPALLLVGLVGYLGLRVNGRERDHEVCRDTQAKDACDKSCARGHQDACAMVGARHAFPLLGGAPNTHEALELLGHACQNGQGCGTLGVLGELGVEGAPTDAEKSFEKACEGSGLECALGIAHVLRGPEGRELDEPWKKRASELDLKAACTHDPDACGLAWLPRLGTPTAAIRESYEKGCAAGSSLACNNLGTLYAEGLAGVEQNPVFARDRFQKACDAGSPSACNNAGFVAGGFMASRRVGPRGEITYKLRCAGPFKVGCAAWGETVRTVPPGTPADLGTAAAAFERACKLGAHVACVNLGALAYVGMGVPVDRARAEQLFASTCFNGDPGACGEQATALLNVRMDHPRDVRGGFGFMQRACKGGEEDACTVVYSMMIDGTPEHNHEADGLRGMKRLADKHVYSHELAQLYETGAEDLPKDPIMARKIAVAMCESDWHCSDLAYYHSRGIGGPKDEGRAITALTNGCEHDDLASCTELGAAFREGRFVGKDPSRAVSLFQKACTAGEWDGCERLADAYATGEGSPKDPVRALSLAREACERGHPSGCARVGLMLADGQGTARDVDAAVPFLAFACRRAAMRSCAKLTELKKPVPELDL